MDLNYEFHQRQSAVSFRVLASPDGPRSLLVSPPCLSYILLFILSSASRLAVAESLLSPPTAQVAPPPPRAIPFSAGTGDEKFWRRHKNAALHFPFKITPFAPFSVYYYQVVQPAFSALRPSLRSPAPYSLPQHTNDALGAYNTRKPPSPVVPYALHLVHPSYGS